ncbi:UDP-N-acetylmuramate--L-alanine ligase [Candidatus Roizmanbacteria bacterium]|nr:UDP-N-acetylmuramate--L-alanine ligase [Candidatus Roizmanbacteria bacterium]
MTDLSQIKAVYFVGIKGVGMTALAVVAKERRMIVSGSDVTEIFATEELLRKKKISLYQGFDPSHIHEFIKKHKNIPKEEILVVTTGAHSGVHNNESEEAKKNDITVITHGEALGMFMQGKRRISVAGTHGKSTTAALLAHILTYAGDDPSYAVGVAGINSLGSSGHFGKGDYFIAEADEYVSDPTSNQVARFLYQTPEIAVITTIDFDHPDVFISLDQVKRVFVELTKTIQRGGCLVANADDPVVRSILPYVDEKIRTYGIANESDFHVERIETKKQKTTFTASYKGESLGVWEITIPGIHNVSNASGAMVVAHEAGIAWEVIRKALPSFTGTKRRFEFVAEVNSIMLYDDYAHHPAEIAATLSAAKTWFPNRQIVVIFQPHTYSRTLALFSEFSRCFADADSVTIAPIFRSAREKPDSSITSEQLVASIRKHHKAAFYSSSAAGFISTIGKKLHRNAILFTMGAGDIYKWHGEIIKALNQKIK